MSGLSKIGSIGKTAFAGLSVAVGGVATALGGLTKSAVDSYSVHEQMVGGIDKLYQNASSKVQEYAKNAYKTSGMSANEYMENASIFASSLLQSVSKVAGDSVEINVDALKEQKQALSDSLDDQIDALKKAHNKEIDDYEKLTEEKIALIDKEYMEKMKLIDEEEYNRLKEIDDQINGINELQKADDERQKEKERNDRINELEERISIAREKGDIDEIAKAEKNLSDYKEKIQAEDTKKARQEQIEDLKNQKSAIKDEMKAKKEQLKEEYSEEVKAIKKDSADQIAVLKEAQAEELKLMQRANRDKLAEFEKYIKAQEEIAKAGADYTYNYTEEAYEKAAELNDLIARDMSDNINVFGNSAEMVKNAYSGLSKGEYRMLDNLRLGYKGSQEEMQRLLDDAEKLSGIKYEMGNFGDMVQAIHVIQENMKITGTTTAEAEKTIEGSTRMMRSAWSNLVGGIADDTQDFDSLVNNFVDSVVAYGNNMLPRIEKALEGAGKLVTQLAPIIINALPELFNTVAIPLLESAINLLGQFGQCLLDNAPALISVVAELTMKLITSLIESLPMFISAIGEVLEVVGQAIKENAPILKDAIFEIINQFSTWIKQNASKVIASGVEVITQLDKGIIDNIKILIPTAIEMIDSIVSGLIDNLDLIMDSAFEVVMAMADGILDNLDIIIDTVLQLVFAYIDAMTKYLPKIIEKLPEILEKLCMALIKYAPILVAAIPEIMIALLDGILESLIIIFKEIPDICKDIVDRFKKQDWSEIGKNIIEGLKNGLFDKFNGLLDTVGEIAEDIFDKACGILGIHSPSKKFSYVAEMCIAGMDNTFEDYDPYATLNKTFKAKSLPLNATLSTGSGMSFDGMNNSLVNALSRMSVQIDGKTAGRLLSGSINKELGRIAQRW